MIDKNLILYISLIISVSTYLFWSELPKGSFYIGNALFMFMICTYIYLKEKSNIGFILFVLTFSNLLDELFFCPTKIQLNELLIWAFALFYFYRNDRKRTRFT